ncbi:hypothetical protein [Flavobacterium beibuense]|uniref:hypothetical protein n=1 Tax=Flavobacterium beibuense TaxID=657326 RepID=UPI003A8E3417
MFKLFSKKDKNAWQIEMLKNVFTVMPTQYSIYLQQINEGLIKNILSGLGDIPGYKTISYHPDVVHKYEIRNEEISVIEGVKVFDLKSSRFIDLEIYIMSGMVSGYVLHTNTKKTEIDSTKIDVSNVKKVKIGNKDTEALQNILGNIPNEISSMLDIQNTFEIETSKGDLYTIKDLENGNYIAIDKNSVIYGLIHNPYEVEELFNNKETFFDALKSGVFNFTDYINNKTS